MLFNRHLLPASLVLSGTALLCACGPTNSPSQSAVVISGQTMGTYYRVSMVGLDKSREPELRKQIEDQLKEDDHELSTYKNDSVLSRFNQYNGTDPQPVSSGMADAIVTALRIGKKTGGEMDITVGPLVNLWGFGPTKEPVKMPTQEQIDAAKAEIGLSHLKVIETVDGDYLQKDKANMYVDLSTVGEGYATDHLARLVEGNGVSNYLVSVGGAVVSRGRNPEGKPWQVAIQKPTDKEDAVEAIVDLQGMGISTSGSYRNYYELDGKRLSHIIDPETGRPITHKLVSATVIAPTALEADGWDTGLMVLGTKKALALAEKEHLAVYLITKEKDGFKITMTPQFKAYLRKAEK
ncbi:FAD:protein FMN transferase ApbE [Rouxiella badensis]|jgi:thiamine biosynthesis lipoprotein|uniref:FAD:protein FMN transferase ApbE n=1 Tax=Rouxiella badensis TaxID=1646377 RepID=UPI00037DDE87|nr:FAD:protein FMN transferase ApbE [Rouxiella badensis]MCC3701687.1 FAD:protein FMN transferase ApbE [Rouxiella badensis]MCC3720125.1 FAD:protein FMN transferase ApbE [Rouxiella badensis]MCC3729788.1 FAD:protein FMN transferase ApbE [Rouxiella badensis]MCC3731329.1 FAD:protein FMN transferase ApbE [Rouxiella badensis]MCC3738264.1 FAD:protein FMN transferase ApbE [Rouxiella badensis]